MLHKLMKTKLFLYLFLLFFSITKEQNLTLQDYSGQKHLVLTDTWQDLLNVTVECPNRGVFKNFILKKENGSFWYEYQCYSSVSEDIDYGEPIIKQVQNINYNQLQNSIENNIQALNQYTVVCNVDYGLNSFKLYAKNGILKRDILCQPLKVTYTSKTTFQTTSNIASSEKMDGLTNILVGRNDTENDTDIGFPLRGFQYVIDTSNSAENPNVYYLYSYSKLKNMAPVVEDYKIRFKELRDANTQKY